MQKQTKYKQPDNINVAFGGKTSVGMLLTRYESLTITIPTPKPLHSHITQLIIPVTAWKTTVQHTEPVYDWQTDRCPAPAYTYDHIGHDPWSRKTCENGNCYSKNRSNFSEDDIRSLNYYLFLINVTFDFSAAFQPNDGEGDRQRSTSWSFTEYPYKHN